MRSFILVFSGLLIAACGKDDGESGNESGSESGTNCDCNAGGTAPVCGVDGMNYDAICGDSCVPVEIACMGMCPCAATEGTSAGGSVSASETTDPSAEGESAEATSAGGACDCEQAGTAPVCGVDDMPYDAACGSSECVPVDIACYATCPCQEFMCGGEVCGPGLPVCTIGISGPSGQNNTFDCTALPAGCGEFGDPDCACANAKGCECVEDPPNYFRVSCEI